MLKNLVFCICDEVDFVREKALKLAEECLSSFAPSSSDTLSRIVEVLLGRVNAVPFPETSEEVRLIIVTMLKAILRDSPEVFKSCMSAVADVLSKVLTDKYPEVKREAAELVSLFCAKLPDYIGLNGKSIVRSLCLNTKHQHAKVRKVTFEVLPADPRQ